jgi:hypothetical protein
MSDGSIESIPIIVDERYLTREEEEVELKRFKEQSGISMAHATIESVKGDKARVERIKIRDAKKNEL